MSTKYIGIAVALLVVGVFVFKPDIFTKPERGVTNEDERASTTIPTLLPVSLSLELPPIGNQNLAKEAWTTFQNYLAAAKAHDLPAIKRLSHQISPTCADPKKEADCFALMDSVYYFSAGFKAEQFKYVESDSKQTVIYTDGPDRAFIYFSRVEGELKVLAIRVCSEDETNICIKDNIDKRDTDKDGWWNSTESLFR